MYIVNIVITPFFRYLIKPYLIRIPSKNITVLNILTLSIVLITISFLLGLITEIPLIIDFFCIKKDLLQESLLKWGPLLSLSIGCIVIPIIEEFFFRFYLNKLFGNIVYLFINIFIWVYIFYNPTRLQIVILILAGIFFIFFISILMERKFQVRRFFYTILKKYFYLFFYLSAFTFALVHVANLEICRKNSILTIVLVLPQLMGGLLLGYTRLKWGVLTGIAIHSIINLVGIGLMFLTN